MEENQEKVVNKPKKVIRLWVFIVSLIATMLISVFLTVALVITQLPKADNKLAFGVLKKNEMFQIEKVFYYLKQNYLDKNITNEQLIQGALKGMAESVGDPYTTYLVNDETAQLDETVNGAFGGIGAELKSDQSRVVISTTMEGSPSQQVGLQADDVITKVDGEDMTGKTISEVVKKVRGEVGTDVVLTIERAGTSLEVKLTRASIAINTVKAELDKEDATIGHIRITSFAKNTAQELEKSVKDLTDKGAQSFVFDVRYNPGGLLDQAYKVANMFLKDGEPIVQVEDRFGKKKIYKASSDIGTFKITQPYVLLVNEGSASASEILAAALKEGAGAQIVGTKTYGKGTVQSVIDISDNSELKYTNAKWLTPKGNWIHKEGVTPTKEVNLPDYAFLKIIDARETLKLGTVSQNVLSVETILKGLGYSVTADGYFDEATQNAVKVYQQKEGLTATGEVDEETAQKLMNSVRVLIQENDTQYQVAKELLK
ncbi:S41 family peptidase [Granulicatella elegans]|uniref:S41 family peptidase n=1 Tax=Granulicatella elegans TaxID=137732 RepID=UPI001D132D42|nr:S41 family peptidase [Granulicatella elegans]UEA31100.1 peptidoglycan-binding protein [Granulicatella elegans]